MRLKMIYNLANIHKNNNTIFSNYQKKENFNEETQPVTAQNMGMIFKEAIDSIFDPTTAMTDKQKEDFVKEIQRKIDKGEKLSYDEMQYLRINNPVPYTKMVKVQMKREALERRLEACKSKQEAQEVYVDAVSRISKDDSAIKETLAAYDNTMEEFKKTDQYKRLPQEEEKEEDKKSYNNE